MIPGLRQLPPSRRDKKQIVAHLDPELVEAVHLRRQRDGVTVQEVIGLAVNKAMGRFGRAPILPVRRDRLVKRKRQLARVQEEGTTTKSRAGKRRVAGWYETASVDRVADFAAEVGAKVEDLVEMGLRDIFSEEDLDAAKVAMLAQRSEKETEA